MSQSPKKKKTNYQLWCFKQHLATHYVIMDTPFNRCGGHFIDPEEFSMNDGWLISMLTEIDCPGYRRYESGLQGDDIV